MGEMKGETYGSKLIENTNDLSKFDKYNFNENSSFSKEENPNALLKRYNKNFRNYVFWRK